ATPIRWQIRHPDVCRVLVSRGAKVDIFTAAAIGDTVRVADMLNDDPNLINSRTQEGDVLGGGNTPLRVAAVLGRTQVARMLIDRGADVQARGGIAFATPLHAAAWYGHPEVAQILLERGAQLEARDERGRHATPLGWAVANARKDM